MSRGSSAPHLTPDHVARVKREIAEAGPVPGVARQTDAEGASRVDRILRDHLAPCQPTRLFAYGSLIRKPEIEHRAEQVAVAQGWHRSFCMWIHRFRGTPDRPGLMMALDQGGQWRGVVPERSFEAPASRLDRMFRREVTVKPINSMPRWLTVRAADGPRRALGFVMNRASPCYTGRLSPKEVARTPARACGHWGSGAEYLLNTDTQLEARGIRDAGLWRLQALVADGIDGMARVS